MICERCKKEAICYGVLEHNSIDSKEVAWCHDCIKEMGWKEE